MVWEAFFLTVIGGTQKSKTTNTFDTYKRLTKKTAAIGSSSFVKNFTYTKTRVTNVADQEVTVGIRPEGFQLANNGALSCKLSSLEVMGRDVSVVSTNEASLNPVVRSIIDADNKVDPVAETIRFDVKPHKIFLFNKETEERIYFEVK
jgi:ABC-type sugar transport system ATPase subunit